MPSQQPSRVPARAHAPRRPPAHQLLVPTTRPASSQDVRTTGAYAPVQPDVEEDEDYRPTMMPRSALRYRDRDGNDVYEQGNRRLIVTYSKPPRRQRHWLLFVGMGMLVVILLWVGLNAFGSWWSNHQLDAQYGNPRTWQVDEVVGHGDSSMHPTHFIFMNLDAHVVVIEIPGGDISHARIYSGPPIFGDNAASLPVTGEFKDVNGDGKVDMLVNVGSQTIVYLNDGAQFKPQ